MIETFHERVQKAQSKDHLRAVAKLTEEVDGTLRFRADPPLLTPADQLFDPDNEAEMVQHLLSGARPSTGPPCRVTASTCSTRYEFVDLARKVVGVGSVGTRCWVALFIGRDEGDPLVLQIKRGGAVGGRAVPRSRASTRTWASGWSRASAWSRAPATSSSAGTR